MPRPATVNGMAIGLRYRHRALTASEVGFIRERIVLHPTASRRELSRKRCQAWNGVQANGAARDQQRGEDVDLKRARSPRVRPTAAAQGRDGQTLRIERWRLIPSRFIFVTANNQ